MTEAGIALYVSVGGGPEADREDLDELARGLARELREVDCVESVEPAAGDRPPEGAKGLSVAAVGTLLLKLAEVGGVSALTGALGAWLSRDKSRTLNLHLGDSSLEVTGLSQEEQQDLVRWFQSQAGLSLEA